MNTTLSSKLLRVLALGIIVTPIAAHAHPGHPGHGGEGALQGLMHPLLGLDHLLAMVAVGIWAVQAGGRSKWLVPATFLSVMTVGLFAGANGLRLPLLEQGVLASVLVFGLFIATAFRLTLAASLPLVGLFAAFHGVVHGMEMPATSNAWNYAAGLVVATALLHGFGMAIASVKAMSDSDRWLKATGSAIATCGIVLWAMSQ